MMEISTADSPNFSYFPVTKTQVTIIVKASNDARIDLRTHLGEESNSYEIVIGAVGNTVSTVKKNNAETHSMEVETLNILNPREMNDFYISWSCDGILTVSRDGGQPFMSFRDQDPFIINYIGIGTANGATGSWAIEEYPLTSFAIRQQLIETCSYWIDYNSEQSFPQNAVSASEDGVCIGRARHRNSVTPGEIRGTTCTIVWGGSIHEKEEFQVLCGLSVNWVKAAKGGVPLCALPAGETEDGYALFIGRVYENGVYYIGKIQPNHQVCYIPFDGVEKARSDYETLVINNSSVLECIGR